jgi:diguanylate cyclase (GGDEF)-like protein
MVAQRDVVNTAEWEAAQARARRQAQISGLLGFLIAPALLVTAWWLAESLTAGDLRYVLAAVLLMVVAGPMITLMVRASLKAQMHNDELIRQITVELADAITLADQESEHRRNQARRQEFETRLANALDMAEGEPEVIDVIERSLTSTLPGAPVELLLADNSHAHLLRMASVSTEHGPPGCTVDSPDRCPAARRAQVQLFDNSDDLDACPKLRGRPAGAVSAVCVPVSIMGRTVGVIHATGEPNAEFATDRVQDLGTLAKLSGARIGLLRVMDETQLQAATDSLTGLLNRRSFEQEVSKARRETPLLTIAIADLDHFKQLNDTYGHETGDRALRLFAQVLAGSVRSQDIVSRHGGEEFVIALTDCTVSSGRVVLDGIRGRLAAAITVAGLPTFSVSIGAIQADPHEELPTLISRADQALFHAKRDGRDRVVVHDAAGRVVPSDIDSDSQSVATPSTVIHLDRSAGQSVAR